MYLQYYIASLQYTYYNYYYTIAAAYRDNERTRIDKTIIIIIIISRVQPALSISVEIIKTYSPTYQSYNIWVICKCARDPFIPYTCSVFRVRK